MDFLRKRWHVLLILLVPLIALAPALRPGTAIGPWDDLRAMMDGKPTPRPFDVLQMDAALQFYGWRDLVFESWGRGEPPFWNPYQLMGTPLLANSQSGGFYPLHMLLGVIHVPTAFAILLLAWFHLAWAGLGVRALVLRLRGAPIGGAVAGAIFAVSPFMLAWVGLASVPTTCAWIPWALVFCLDLFDPSRPRLKSSALLGACLAMMLLGGHLQFCAYGFMSVALAGAWQAVATKRWLGLGSAVAGCALGALLAAPQLLPVLEYSGSSHRQNTPTEAGYGYYLRGAVQPIEAAGVVFPDALGTPGRAAPLDDLPVKLGSFWPAYTKIGGNYAESAIYLGPAIVFLLALAFFRKGWREVGAVSAIGVLGVLLAFGTPLDRLLYFTFPGWSATGSPGRASFLFLLAACVIAGWAWPRDGEKFCVRKPTYVLLGTTILAIALVALFATAQTAWNPNLQSVLESAVKGDLAFVLPVALIGLVLVAAGALALKRAHPIYAALSLILASILIGGPRLVPTGTPLQREPSDPNVRTAFVNRDWQLLIGIPVVEPPNTATIQRKYDVAGYDSLINKGTFLILNEINGSDSAPEANGNMTLIKPGFDVDLLARAGVSEVVALDGSGEVTQEQLLGARAVFELPPSENVRTGRARVVSDSLTKSVVEATGPGTMTLRDRNMPGWAATVDGTPTEIKGDRWREVELPEGAHTVVFTYAPPGLKTGLALFAVGALASLLCLALGRPKKTQ